MDIDDYKGPDMSLSSLWSWRGLQCKKYLGFYPDPKDIGKPRNHSFYDPDFIDCCETFNSEGKLLKREFRHHGRKIRPNERLWAERVAPHYDPLRTKHDP